MIDTMTTFVVLSGMVGLFGIGVYRSVISDYRYGKGKRWM